MSKTRLLRFEIEHSEIERLCKDKLGIQIELVITHANVKIVAKAEDGEPLKLERGVKNV